MDCGAALKRRAANVGTCSPTFAARGFSPAPQPFDQPLCSLPELKADS